MNINNIDIYKIGSGDSTYEIYKSKKLGTGTYSSVLLGKCISEKKAKEINRSDKLVAIKKINIAKLSTNGAKMLTTEIEIMKEIINYSHSNIIKCYDVIDDIDVIYIVMEYCDGGDFSSLLIKKPIKYEYIKYFFQQIISAMVFLHDNKIIHRDIKPKNILILNKNKILKLADFGFAKHLDTFKRTLTVCGSPLYMAPEIYQKVGYTESVDVWSLGIILYEMVFGKHPLNDYVDPKSLANFVMNDDIYIPEDKYVNKSCLNLLKKMLKRKESDRITIEELFCHPWIHEKCDISNISGSIYRENNSYSSDESFDSENSDDDDVGFLFKLDQ
jgi:serine/threonine protein kinase